MPREMWIGDGYQGGCSEGGVDEDRGAGTRMDCAMHIYRGMFLLYGF